jgi:uncharacterized integral membrane protein
VTDDGLQRAAPTRGTGVTRYVVAVLVLAVLSVVLAIQNSERTDVDLLVWSGEAPVYAVAAIALLIGAAVTAAISAIWRRRRTRHNRELQELAAHRGRRNRSDDVMDNPRSVPREP